MNCFLQHTVDQKPQHKLLQENKPGTFNSPPNLRLKVCKGYRKKVLVRFLEKNLYKLGRGSSRLFHGVQKN